MLHALGCILDAFRFGVWGSEVRVLGLGLMLGALDVTVMFRNKPPLVGSVLCHTGGGLFRNITVEPAVQLPAAVRGAEQEEESEEKEEEGAREEEKEKKEGEGEGGREREGEPAQSSEK
eukprot:1953959-Rhodomonas_salina.1